MGFAGWLSSHGVGSYQRQANLGTILRGGPDAAAAIRAEKITHITVDAGAGRDRCVAFGVEAL